MQIQRGKIFLKKEELEQIELCLKFKKDVIKIFPNEGIFSDGISFKSHFRYDSVEDKIKIEVSLFDENGNHIYIFYHDIFLIIDVLNILSIKYGEKLYLIKIEIKDINLLEKMKYSVHYNILNLIMFNNFNNEIDLLEVTYTLLYEIYVNSFNSFNSFNLDDDIVKLLKDKFEYYGYTENDSIPLHKIYNQKEISKEEVLNNLVGLLLTELYNLNLNRHITDSDINKCLKDKLKRYNSFII